MSITIDQIQSNLIESGYNKFKNKTRNRIAVLTDEDRVTTLKRVAENFSAYGARSVSYTHLTLPTICSV